MGFISILSKAVFTVIALFIARFTYNYVNSPLKSFPGHWASAFTNLWRLLLNATRKMQITHVDLHRQYGPAVRMGPNIVSLSDPGMIGKVFTTKGIWAKGDFYMPNDVVVNGQRMSNLFSTRDEKFHSTAVRPVKGLYSMTWVSNHLEGHVDKMLEAFATILEERFDRGAKPVDLADYLAYFAWDSMSQMTIGRTYGMMENGSDMGDVIDVSTRGLDYFAIVSQIPKLDLWLDKNPVKRVGPPPFTWATVYAYKAVAERKAEPAEQAASREKDYLDYFLAAGKDDAMINDDMVAFYMLSNVLAGSDTTAIYMIAAMYYIIKTPGVIEKIRAEFAEHEVPRGEPVSWKATQSMPYFVACMKEAGRIHPGVGIMIERNVPAQGVSLPDGRFIPGGTTVGMNPWVVNRSEEYYGPDTDKFMPERFLRQEGESEEAFDTRSRKMKAADLTFGAGARICLGKNTAIFQATKSVATLLNKFDIEFVDPAKEWTVRNSWFVYEYDVNVTLKPRKS